MNVVCLPTERQGVHMNSFRNNHAFQDRIGIWKCWFLRRGENRSSRRKTSQSRVENQQQTQPTYDAGSGNWTWELCWEANTLTTAPTLLPKGKIFSLINIIGWSSAKDKQSFKMNKTEYPPWVENLTNSWRDILSTDKYTSCTVYNTDLNYLPINTRQNILVFSKLLCHKSTAAGQIPPSSPAWMWLTRCRDWWQEENINNANN